MDIGNAELSRLMENLTNMSGFSIKVREPYCIPFKGNKTVTAILCAMLISD